MRNYVDDDKPMRSEPKGFVEKFKERHKQFNDYMKKSRVGTLAGFEDMIKRRKEGKPDANK